MFTIRNFHIHKRGHLYVTNIDITNKTCNLTHTMQSYYAIICNTLVTTNNYVCNKYSKTFPSKGKEELIGRLKIVSYPANLLHNDEITVNGNKAMGRFCADPL